MATIGTFKRHGGNYRGTIKTLTLSVGIELRPAAKEHDKSPDFRIHGPHGEFGAAWTRRSSAGRDYLSCKLDDPLFAARRDWRCRRAFTDLDALTLRHPSKVPSQSGLAREARRLRAPPPQLRSNCKR